MRGFYTDKTSRWLSPWCGGCRSWKLSSAAKRIRAIRGNWGWPRESRQAL